MHINFVLNYNELKGQSSNYSNNQMKRARRSMITTTKLVATLNRCKISDRNIVHIIIAVSKAFNHDINDFIVNRTSINPY